MIINEIFRKPIISFGLGKNELTCLVDDEINIYQLTTYIDTMAIVLITDLPNSKIDNNNFIVVADAIGVYDIKITNGTTKQDSNIITLIVE